MIKVDLAKIGDSNVEDDIVKWLSENEFYKGKIDEFIMKCIMVAKRVYDTGTEHEVVKFWLPGILKKNAVPQRANKTSLASRSARQRDVMSITDQIMDYMELNEGTEITSTDLMSDLDIASYNTAIGTLHRLHQEGSIIRIKKGTYVYKKEEKDDAENRV